ncbi:MAG: EscU/YscU/HrcU family type III secretion system export apparatus switch protein [Clostridiales Family XIII bacterium]|jgi:flagellar biosynthesis protein|nr:EscU/YscU/HrcU family type III secretion system export apparatus switch protein [Clostridiales Family XIII bacterium]
MSGFDKKPEGGAPAGTGAAAGAGGAAAWLRAGEGAGAGNRAMPGLGAGASDSADTGDVAGMRVAALKYDAENDMAPHVVAAGSGYTAQRILQVAIENGISIYHDDSAATMLAKLGAGKEIPPELYQIVVNIYMALLDTAARRLGPPASGPAQGAGAAGPGENSAVLGVGAVGPGENDAAPEA